ncbi:MAG: glycoside hydrolase family 26 protein [Acidimicrobiales bacterium]
MAMPAAANALTSPQTKVKSPAQGSIVTADVTVRGSASHGRGVAEVRLVFKNLDDRTYWNGHDWQDEFVRFSVPVDRPGAKQTSWSYVMPWQEMTEGNYRARAFARSVDGNGDSSGGDRKEFSYRTNHDLYDTEITGPTGAISDAEPITVVGRGRSSEGVALVRVAIHHRESKQYWNGESQQWQKRYVNSLAELDEPGGNDVNWQVVIPAGSNLVGHYTARAWVRTSTDKGDPFGRGRTSFETVATPPPTTTTTVPPTTTPPTTTPPTTAPPTTAPPTTRPPTTTPPTTTPPTTAPPTTTPPTTQPPTTQPSTTAPTTAPPTTAPPSTQPPCAGGNAAILVPCSGVLIGASGDFKADDGSSQSKQDHFARMEERLDADFDIFHDFLQWRDMVSKTWPNAKTQALADDGHILLTNWKSPTQSVTDWARIADGVYDADIRTAAGQVKAFGEPTFITFFHEPEDNIRDTADGDQAKVQQYIDDYSAAFRHIHDVFESAGADNAIWVWDMQGWLGGFESYYENGLYPGDDIIDWVGWNPYNWYGCENHNNPRKWKTFDQVISPFYNWLDEGGPNRPSLDKPMMLGEWGSEENDGASNSSQTKAEWLDDARRMLPTQFPRLRAVVYFDTEGRRADNTVQFCEWAIDSSPSSMAAMTSLLTDPVLTARW